MNIKKFRWTQGMKIMRWKIKPEFVTGIISIFAPICSITIMLIVEQEFTEAIMGNCLLAV